MARLMPRVGCVARRCFLHSSLDPCSPPGLVQGAQGLFRAVYLEQLIPDWLAQQPDDPYLAVLAPLVLASTPLRQQTPRLWQTIQQADLAPNIRDTLSEILLFWISDRFKTLSKQEIWNMLNLSATIQETPLYQEIYAEGEAAGEARGKAGSLKHLLTRRLGALPEWAMQRIDTATMDQLDAWLDGVLDADNLSGLLNSSAH